MSPLRLAYRLASFSVHLFVGVVLCVFVLSGDPRRPMAARQRKVIGWWLRRCGRIAGLRIRTVGEPSERRCFVANHVSWMDIIVLGGLHAVRFLSKAEVAHWPVIGFLANRAGTLYIRRGEGAGKAFDELKAALRQNDGVALFPEGRTAKDYTIQRFHPRLFGAPLDVGVHVQPVAICYPSASGPNADVLFVGDESFLANTMRILKRKRTDVEVRYPEAVRETSRESFAGRAHALIVEAAERSYGK